LIDYGVDADVILRIIEDGKAFQTVRVSCCNRPWQTNIFKDIEFSERPVDVEKHNIKKDLG